MRHIAIIAAGFALASASSAFAQEGEPLPRFEALEQQTLALEQQRLDRLETQRQRELLRPVAPTSGVSQADKALRALEIEREMDRVRLEGAQMRAQVQRERDLAEASLPNRRIASHSTLVIRDPERYILPPAPPGQYYARLEGRFVLVDAASELVLKVLDPRPTDPKADVPLGPPPPLQTPLPTARIGPNSPHVIPDPASMSLPAAPRGQYYAKYNGQILLIDANTQRAIKAIGG